MKFTVDRKTWIRGESSWDDAKATNESMLLNQKLGKMCCLGFLAKACGSNDSDIRNIGIPEAAPCVVWPPWVLFMGYNSLATEHLIKLNDDVDIGDDERERRIKEEFAAHGDEVEFVG